MEKTINSTKVITGLVRLSYAHLFEPTAKDDGGTKKYSCALLIPKSDKATIKKIEAAIAEAKEQGKSSKFGGKIPAGLKLPLRDGDEERPDDEVYAGHYFVNASSVQKPGLVDRDRNQIIDPADLYSGCYVYASINFFAFNTSGNKGIACGLNNIMKVKDGEALGGRARAEEDFADVKVDEDDDLL
jgi:hypothetical protein